MIYGNKKKVIKDMNVEKEKGKEGLKLGLLITFGCIAMFGLVLVANLWGLWPPFEMSDIIQKGMSWGMGMGALIIVLAYESGQLLGSILCKRLTMKKCVSRNLEIDNRLLRL